MDRAQNCSESGSSPEWNFKFSRPCGKTSRGMHGFYEPRAPSPFLMRGEKNALFFQNFSEKRNASGVLDG